MTPGLSAFVSLALTASVSGTILPDGGVDMPLQPNFSDPLYAQCPESADAGLVTLNTETKVWTMPDARAHRVGCLMATCDERRQQLEPIPLLSWPAFLTVTIVGVLALGLGMYFGTMWPR